MKRRSFLGLLGTGAAAAAFPGSLFSRAPRKPEVPAPPGTIEAREEGGHVVLEWKGEEGWEVIARAEPGATEITIPAENRPTIKPGRTYHYRARHVRIE